MKRTPGQAGPDGYVDTFDYNDSADALAKASAEGKAGSIVDHTTLPGKQMTTIKRHIYKKLREQWAIAYAEIRNMELQKCPISGILSLN